LVRESESLQRLSMSSSMSAMAKSITDRNSLRDILEPLLRFIDGLELIREGNPDDARSRFVDGLESSRAETEGNADGAIRRFAVDGFESLRAETEGNAADDAAIRRFMPRLELSDSESESESLLGSNGMLLEAFGWKVVEGRRWKQSVL
jgi:hypothetical protein